MEFILPAIMVLSIVQSVFGVGLLIFGTPTLLLLGLPYGTTLSYLLPCSLTISALQLAGRENKLENFEWNILKYTLPFVMIGLSLVLGHPSSSIKPMIGIAMVLTAILTAFPALKSRVTWAARRAGRMSFVVIGAVHGLTNMGGGLLTVLSAAHFRDKQSTRSGIAFGYFFMALSQMAVLMWKREFHWDVHTLLFMAICALTYRLVGGPVYRWTSETLYQRCMTFLILVFGVTLLAF